MPTIRALFDRRATRAVLAFFRETEVGIFVSAPPRGGEEDEADEETEEEEGTPRMGYFFRGSFVSFFPLVLFLFGDAMGSRGQGGPALAAWRNDGFVGDCC